MATCIKFKEGQFKTDQQREEIVHVITNYLSCLEYPHELSILIEEYKPSTKIVYQIGSSEEWYALFDKSIDSLLWIVNNKSIEQERLLAQWVSCRNTDGNLADCYELPNITFGTNSNGKDANENNYSS